MRSAELVHRHAAWWNDYLQAELVVDMKRPTPPDPTQAWRGLLPCRSRTDRDRRLDRAPHRRGHYRMTPRRLRRELKSISSVVLSGARTIAWSSARPAAAPSDRFVADCAVGRTELTGSADGASVPGDG